MKRLLITLSLMLAIGAQAAEYNCRTRMIKLELKTTKDLTTLIIRDVQTGEFYFNGIMNESLNRDGITDMMFETGSHIFLQLKFKTSALNEEAEKLFGFARGWYGAGFVDDSIQCMKNEKSKR